MWYQKNSLLVFLTLLVMTLSVEAKDSHSKFAINGKMGYFLPQGDSEVDKIYSGSQVFSLSGMYNLSSAFSLVLGLDYQKLDSIEEDKWEVAKVEEDYLRIMPLTFSIIYKIPIGNPKGFLPYIGGGTGVYYTKLKYTVSEIPNQYLTWTVTTKRGEFPVLKVSKLNLSDSHSAKAIGFQLIGGFNYYLFSHLFLTGEIKYAYAPISKWNDIDVGGVTVLGGINYLF
ncbi:MAG: outer membrane beta-barrel protein [bacterium]